MDIPVKIDWINSSDTRTGMSVDSLKRAFIDNLFYIQGRFWDVATLHDLYIAAAYTVRDRILERWIRTAKTYKNQEVRTVCYLSAEYLLGPHLENNLLNLGIMDVAKQVAKELDINFDEILDQEPEPGLGNGGLGRLVACYMESLATLQIPAIGYGIRYEFGIFEQSFENGWQKEFTDFWLRDGNPWEIARPKLRFPVKFGGRTEHSTDQNNQLRVNWIPDMVVNGVAHDTPVSGFGVSNTNLLRLWSSEASSSFDFEAFNAGDYYRAVHAKIEAENITKVLYPNNEPEVGKELRLKQQYFFVSCSLQDMLRLHLLVNDSISGFQKKFVIQLNDTHPAIAVPELMRLLVDEHNLNWDDAWEITRNTFAFTNHTLLPEAQETWPIKLFIQLLPRHLEIIYEINQRFLDEVRMYYLLDNAHERAKELSIIGYENGQEVVRMSHLAMVGSFAVNGVAELHTHLLRSTIMKEFNEYWPNKFHNITNGVTPRRYLRLCNPELAQLICDKIGGEWIVDLNHLSQLKEFVNDRDFKDEWRAVKRRAKCRLADQIKIKTGATINPDSLFDIQAKRIHEYKRQHLNILHIINLYERIKQNPNIELTPRTFIFGGKAAPGYYMAKLIIKLINSVVYVINQDPAVRELLKVVFFPNFNVKNSQSIYPAADISEQISTAGMEASGTSNMKFTMNGALTIGTLDGANIEILSEVGAENYFLFGLTAEQVAETRLQGYRPWEIYNENSSLKNAIDLINSGLFSHGEKDYFKALTNRLLDHDPYLVLADYQSYIECQSRVGVSYRDTELWAQKSILNIARVGKFSSDRSIREYCKKIWNVAPVTITTQ